MGCIMVSENHILVILVDEWEYTGTGYLSSRTKLSKILIPRYIVYGALNSVLLDIYQYIWYSNMHKVPGPIFT